MSGEIRRVFSLGGLRHLTYLPVIIGKIENWMPFLLNYIGLKNSGEEYRFRNGVRIVTRDRTDSATVAVIFIKRDYSTVKDGSTVIDIGANIGVYSVYAATESRHTSVYAYEPAPANYDLLLKNIQINNLEENILPFSVGVAAKRGKRRLYLSRISPFNSLYADGEQGTIEVDCVSLIDVFELNRIDHCDILKVDCEGAEFEILYATPRSVFERISGIRMEYHNVVDVEGYQIDRLKLFLEDNGFRTMRLLEGSKVSGTIWLER